MPRPPPEAQAGHPRNYRSRFHTGNSGGEGGYSDAEREFMVALGRWKREHRQPFPTCSECLAVLISLGYRKAGEP